MQIKKTFVYIYTYIRIKRCGDPRCRTCVHLEEGDEKILKIGKYLNHNADCK